MTPFRSWKHWLINQDSENQKPLNSDEKTKIINYRRMVTLASRYHLVNANCLPKSLTLKWMLEKQNIHSELKMGLSADQSNFHGHAWLERKNTVLNDDQNVAERYPVKQEIEQQPLHIKNTNRL